MTLSVGCVANLWNPGGWLCGGADVALGTTAAATGMAAGGIACVNDDAAGCILGGLGAVPGFGSLGIKLVGPVVGMPEDVALAGSLTGDFMAWGFSLAGSLVNLGGGGR